MLRYRYLFLLLVLLTTGALTAADNTLDPTQQQLSERIDTLIEQLGHKNYAARQRAQAELVRFGLAAFDSLLEAQDKDEVEIALRARYLLNSMQIAWIREDDSPEVKGALRDYEQSNAAERQSKIDRLASLSDFAGIEALSRIVRFETRETLSKLAALAVIGQDPPTDLPARKALAKRINQSVGVSQRHGGQWLRVYSQTLNDPTSAVEQWSRLAREEQEIFALSPVKSSAKIVGTLLLWQADMLRSLERHDEAVAVLFRRLSLLDDDRVAVLETVDWLIDREAWQYFDEFSRRVLPTFNDDSELLYRLAEAREKQGKPEQAEQIALQAFELQPEEVQAHRLISVVLHSRGQFDWAERELRFVIKNSALGDTENINANFYLSTILHDNGRDRAAAEVLQAFFDGAEKDPVVMKQLARYGSVISETKARMNHYYYLDLAAQEKWAEAKQKLEQAILLDPTDADVIIAMYRFPNQDDAWQQRTRTLINSAATTFRRNIEETRRAVDSAPNTEYRMTLVRRLALFNNQYAWLIGNTEGDYDEALACSHRSLELRPGTAGYLDTLGRCYYAKKDYENALKYQREAIRLDPHSGLMKKQLALFEKAAAEQAAASEKPPK